MNSNLNLVALLPMKAISERVPNKNFKDFRGKPLYRWILDTLLEIEEIDCVIINTDARELLESSGLVESERVIIRDRKPELLGNYVPMNHVLADDVAAYSSALYLMTHTTNPLLSKSTIKAALAEFENKKFCDSLFSVNKVQTRFYRGDATPVNHDPLHLLPTQELEPWYEENSNLYLFTSEGFQQNQSRIGNSPILFETPRLQSLDIDTPEDWELTLLAAEAIGQTKETK